MPKIFEVQYCCNYCLLQFKTNIQIFWIVNIINLMKYAEKYSGFVNQFKKMVVCC